MKEEPPALKTFGSRCPALSGPPTLAPTRVRTPGLPNARPVRHFHGMIRRIQDVRIGYKTGIVVIVLALILWGLVSYVRIKDFVPEELKHPVAPAPGQVS